MYYWKYIIREFLVASVLLVPCVALIWREHIRDWKRIVAYCLFAVYLSAIYFLVGLPTLPTLKYMKFYPNVNLIPFEGILADYRNTILNIALFFPFGFLLPLFWVCGRKGMRTVCLGLCISLTIEVIQLFLGRATDINDLITNTAGTAVGFLLSLPFLKVVHPIGKDSDLPALFGLVAAVMFLIQPYLVDLF